MSNRNRRNRREQTPKGHRHLNGAVEEILRAREEIPLPERPRLERVPDFIPVVLKVQGPRHNQHPRETFMGGSVLLAYVTHQFHEHDECRFHTFDLQQGRARFGYAVCSGCGAEAWSAWWVAAGLYGLAASLTADLLGLEVPYDATPITMVDLDAYDDVRFSESPEDGTGYFIVEHVEHFEALVAGSAS